MLCFDTLLQVFILKVVRGGHKNRSEERAKAAEKDNAETRLPDGQAQRSLRYRRGTPTPGVFGKEAASC